MVDLGITAAMAKRSPLAMASLTSNGKLKPYAHLQKIDRKLIDVIEGRCKRLIIQMPPQHGKSELASRTFPAVCLDNNPDLKLVAASYNVDLSKTACRANRDLALEWGEDANGLLGYSVRADTRAAKEWSIAGRRGGLLAVGAGSGFTGRPADGIIIDDPIKGYKEALSKKNRDDTWDWYTTVATTRLSEDGFIIIILTRWHVDDLAGRILRGPRAADWEVISLPAINEQGQPLCPEMHSLKQLEEFRDTMGHYKWSCLYQQNPVHPDECRFPPELFDDIFDWKDSVSTNTFGWPGPLKHRVISVDKSWGGDNTAIVEGGVPMSRDGNFYLRINQFKASDPDTIANNIVKVMEGGDVKPPSLVWIEENRYAGKDYGDLTHLVRLKLKKLNRPYGNRVVAVSKRHHNLKDTPTGQLKAARILGLYGSFSKKKFRFLDTPGARKAIDQFTDFRPEKSNNDDDGPDAIARAWECLGSLVRRKN